MWALVQSGEHGLLDRDSVCFGMFYEYDEACTALDDAVVAKAEELGLSVEENSGANYDEGTGFVDSFGTSTFLFAILEI